MSTDLGASYNLTNEGVRLLSASQREFHLHAAGHETRTAAEREAAAKIGSVAPDARATPGSLGDHRNGARVSSDRRPGSDTPPRWSDDDRRDGETVVVNTRRDFSESGATGDMTVDVLPFDVIGAGAGGSVKRAIHVPTHTFIALKVMTVFDREKRKQLVNELRALADADKNRDGCENVVGFLGAYYDAKHETVCVALEFADGGSLESALERAGRPMPPVVVGDVCAQVAAGLEYLHEKKRLVHRDVKPGNVLVRRSGACKITDFGIVARSKMMEETETNDVGGDEQKKLFFPEKRGFAFVQGVSAVHEPGARRAKAVRARGGCLVAGRDAVRVRAGQVPLRRAGRRRARARACDLAGERDGRGNFRPSVGGSRWSSG
jgi:hypothetical protein